MLGTVLAEANPLVDLVVEAVERRAESRIDRDGKGSVRFGRLASVDLDALRFPVADSFEWADVR